MNNKEKSFWCKKYKNNWCNGKLIPGQGKMDMPPCPYYYTNGRKGLKKRAYCTLKEVGDARNVRNSNKRNRKV